MGGGSYNPISNIGSFISSSTKDIGSALSTATTDIGSTISTATTDTINEVGRVELDPIADLQDPIGAATKVVSKADTILKDPVGALSDALAPEEDQGAQLIGGSITSTLGGQVEEEEEVADPKKKKAFQKKKGTKSLQIKRPVVASAQSQGVQI